MDFSERKILGKTGLKVGRLGIASGYRGPVEAFEEAFDRGCNYFTLGTVIRGYSPEMKKSIINIVKKGQRENLVLAMFTYAHHAYLTEFFLLPGLKSLSIDYADILILGYFPKRPNNKIIEGALRLKEKGLIRFLGISSHNRRLFPELAKEGIFDVFHIRYNAVHRGAEIETFPDLIAEDRPGIVSFTATSWGQLLNQKKMPKGEIAPSALDCYRFVLSNPSVDVCMTGARNIEQMRDNLVILNRGPMSKEELSRMIKIGDYIYGRHSIFSFAR